MRQCTYLACTKLPTLAPETTTFSYQSQEQIYSKWAWPFLVPCFGIVFQCTSDHVTHSAPSRETSVSTLTQPHKTAYTPPPPTPLIWLCRPVLAITDAGIIVYHITEKCFTVATALCVCVSVSVSVSGCSIAYSDLWSDLHFFSTGGGMDTKIRVSTESWLWRRKFTSRSCRDSNPRPFDHESCTLTTELSPPPNHLPSHQFSNSCFLTERFVWVQFWPRSWCWWVHCPSCPCACPWSCWWHPEPSGLPAAGGWCLYWCRSAPARNKVTPGVRQLLFVY